MRIVKIDINNFKGQSFSLDLTGRDLIVAPNMVGKTTIKEAVDFLATGLVSSHDFKREDLIDYAPGGSFEVTATTDTGLVVSRWFKVKKGGATEIDLTFDPDGTEDNYTQRKERLAEEFENAPLVTFDLAKFVYGDDAYRLETCLALMPVASTADIKDKMHLELEAVGDKLRHGVEEQSAKDAIMEVKDQLQGFGARLPTNLLGRCEALAGLVKDKWAKVTRAEVATKTKAVRALGTISREDGVTGVNVEALQEQLRQAQTNMDDLQKASGAAEERRKLMADLTERIDDGQVKMKQAKAGVKELAGVVNGLVADVEKVNAEAKAHEEAELERIALGHEQIAALRGSIADNKTDRDSELGHSEAAEDSYQRLTKLLAASRALIDAQEAALIALGGSDGRCAVCATPLDADSKELLLAALREKLNGDLKELESLVSRVDAAEREKMQHHDTYLELLSDISDMEGAVGGLMADLEPRPYHGLATDAIKSNLVKKENALEKAKLKQQSLQASIFGWMKERGELANEMPEEMEQSAIAGAEAERDRIAERIEEAKRARQRFEDQEKLRKELDEAERRLEALKKWGDALGLKGLAGKILADQFQPLIEPAAALVRRVIPDAELAISWETPRGNPGMRLFLHRMPGEKLIAYKAMSGAEKAIVGTAVALAFAGSEKPPSLLCLECEVMDDEVEKRYLEALADLAGPTALLVMTHHGHDDLGVYTIRRL